MRRGDRKHLSPKHSQCGQPLETRRRGAIAVLAAMILPVMLGFVACAVDIGYILHAKAELQRTADACAMASVRCLPTRSNAREMAKAVARDNLGTVGAELEDYEIEFGFWTRSTGTFSASTYTANAIRVTVARSAAKGNPLRLFFAAFMGHTTTDVSATAVAMYDNEACGILIGIDSVSLAGTPDVDSYNSTYASYNAQVPQDNGDFCSNGWIDVDGTTYVRGDANAGPGEETTVNNNSTVTGSTKPRLRSIDLPTVDMSGVASNNDNNDIPGIPSGNGKSTKSAVDKQGDLKLVAGETMDLPPGNYYLRNLELGGGSTLNITGETNIYLTGDLKVAGGASLNNNTERPDYLNILMSGGDALVTSDLAAYMVIYAPNTDIDVQGSADFYGAFVGKTLKIHGTGSVHADEAVDFNHYAVQPKRVALVQ